eukprot:CAMPEP_0177674378 /NCGR_PEP_ID=MMETSP0447-20121125/26519_1 /TAXON_ID=0 /ORGANISM="Stygamoeba regulata, Strain BSH-02190019" /LENGTH=311 /DNA_ID=CAMNT_0019182461 /DNA_START=147 /DNA_END=1082 /DNA_ORIENTATION=-
MQPAVSQAQPLAALTESGSLHHDRRALHAVYNQHSHLLRACQLTERQHVCPPTPCPAVDDGPAAEFPGLGAALHARSADVHLPPTITVHKHARAPVARISAQRQVQLRHARRAHRHHALAVQHTLHLAWPDHPRQLSDDDAAITLQVLHLLFKRVNAVQQARRMNRPVRRMGRQVSSLGPVLAVQVAVRARHRRVWAVSADVLLHGTLRHGGTAVQARTRPRGAGRHVLRHAAHTHAPIAVAARHYPLQAGVGLVVWQVSPSDLEVALLALNHHHAALGSVCVQLAKGALPRTLTFNREAMGAADVQALDE